MSTPRYSVGLTSKVLTRARKILGCLLLLLVVFIIAGIHQGVVSKDFDKILLKPFREFATDFQKATEPAPIPTLAPLPYLSPTPTPIPTKKSAPVIQPQSQPVVSNCIRKNIREGEFASNKCYLQADYEDLQYYLGRYNNSVFDRDSAVSFMGITCGGRSEMFQQDCEKQKARKAEAETNMDKYRGIIQGIIAKGR